MFSGKRFSGKRIAATLAAAGGLLCAPLPAVAGESGSFTSISVLTSSVTTLQQSGQTIFAGPSEGASVVTQSSGDPFAVGGHTEMKWRGLRQDDGKRSESGGALHGEHIDQRRAVPAFEADRGRRAAPNFWAARACTRASSAAATTKRPASPPRSTSPSQSARGSGEVGLPLIVIRFGIPAKRGVTNTSRRRSQETAS